MEELPQDSVVVSCVVDARPLTALDRVTVRGIQKVIDYFALTRLAPAIFSPVDFCADSQRDIAENFSRYQEIYDLLSDEISKRAFQKVLLFRYTMDVEYMRGLSFTIDQQYLESFFAWRKDEVFVDGGGYDGQTTLNFIAKYGTYRVINYFEPVPEMMKVSRENLADLRDIRFFQKGLFDRNARVRFDEHAGSASHISTNGEIEIEVVRLDDEVDVPISSIKLDIEGVEYEALQGAAKHIRLERPKLAVCVYHNQVDFWRIPQRVLELYDGYRIYFRHYSEGILESVMFFVPGE